MTDREQREAAKAFTGYWQGRGYEKGESQPFWLSLLRDVLGIEHPEQYIRFEEQTKIDRTSFIDGMIPATHVLIEQKGVGKDLRAPIRQSDGTALTPFQQALRYSVTLPYSERPRWIVTCNFEEFLIYDMEKPTGAPESILLSDLPKEYYRLAFLTDTGNENIRREMEISIQAGDLVGALYDEILRQYRDPTNPESLKSLNMLCVRLVFCLYAEDAGIFGGRTKFHDYIKAVADKDVKDVRRALIDLFKILDTKPQDRDPYDDSILSSFPYVNGGLFEKEDIEIPQFNEKIVALLLHEASEDFDWSKISPTIFGAVFESTLNPETRRAGGMHYTSIENIHKVIDPLFLDDLRDELSQIQEIKVEKTRNAQLENFRAKLASLTFLDPACGSGNFLTETYISLRRLENEALETIHRGQMVFGSANPIQVGIRQFYGIEINDFAVTVAKTALWIAESQMMKETEDIVHINLEFLPLKSYANIIEGNALRMDWQTVVPKETVDYIMGNPPFVGYAYQTKAQKDDLQNLDTTIGNNIDYVAGWYFKAAQHIRNTNTRVAFVSTNSITQGEQVAAVWKPLYEKYKIHIDFAHRTFRWDSEASLKAQVHCVIVGFSAAPNHTPKVLFSSERQQVVENINAYLLNAPDIFIEKRTKPICNVTEIIRGSSPNDDGNLLMTREEYEQYAKTEPQGVKYVRPFMMGKDFIQRKPRYCFWLPGVNPNELKQCPLLLKRIENVKKFRSNSNRARTLELAGTPTLFEDMRISDNRYIAIPKVSSQNRRYIPIDYLESKVIPGDKLFFMKNATMYDFGILMSNVHNAWMRAICGRLKSDYSYSNTIVYNNFPWCDPTPEQKQKIEETAQDILHARALYPDSSLADLYDEVIMPPELRRAHQQNDKAVMQAYGFPIKMTESECVAALMQLYVRLTEKK